MNWYLEVLKKYVVFSGRARRKEYWIFGLINLIAFIVLLLIDILIGTFDYESEHGILSSIYVLITFLPNLAVSIRRLHDIGKSGWWVMIFLIPIIGQIVLLIFMCTDSQVGDNQFGPNPKIEKE